MQKKPTALQTVIDNESIIDALRHQPTWSSVLQLRPWFSSPRLLNDRLHQVWSFVDFTSFCCKPRSDSPCTPSLAHLGVIPSHRWATGMDKTSQMTWVSWQNSKDMGLPNSWISWNVLNTILDYKPQVWKVNRHKWSLEMVNIGFTWFTLERFSSVWCRLTKPTWSMPKTSYFEVLNDHCTTKLESSHTWVSHNNWLVVNLNNF